MRPLIAPLAALLLAGCAGGAGYQQQSAVDCFPAQNEDLMPPIDEFDGWQLVCGTSRLKPGAAEKYRERYPEAFGAATPSITQRAT